MTTEKTYYTLKEACRVTGLSMYFLRNGCKAGSVPCVKSGTAYYVNVPRLLEKLEQEEKRASV